jgi:hypothetical protein
VSALPLMFVSIKTTTEHEEFLKTALLNAGMPIKVDERKRTDAPLKLTMPANISSLSVLLHVMESIPETVSGEVRLQDGRTFALDESGKAQLRELLSTAMRQPQPSVQQAPVWWMYFLPQIGKIIEEVAGLVHWYPRAVGEGQRTVVTYFVALILAIVAGVGVLTYVGKVSGESFVFVTGILLGYIFAFLSKYLGVIGSGD